MGCRRQSATWSGRRCTLGCECLGCYGMVLDLLVCTAVYPCMRCRCSGLRSRYLYAYQPCCSKDSRIYCAAGNRCQTAMFWLIHECKSWCDLSTKQTLFCFPTLSGRSVGICLESLAVAVGCLLGKNAHRDPRKAREVWLHCIDERRDRSLKLYIHFIQH
jgi:hypothetical protein